MVQQSILYIFFGSEWLIVKSYLCFAITEATDAALVKKNDKKFFLCYCPSL